MVKASKVLCNPPVLPHQRQLPRGLDDGTPQHTFTSIVDHYRRGYFKAINCVKGELQRRFQQENLIFVKSIESLLVDSANGKSLSLSSTELCGRDLDMDKLQIHLKMIPDIIKATALDGIPWMVSQSRKLPEFRLFVTF